MKRFFKQFICFIMLLLVISNSCIIPVLAVHNHVGALCGTNYEVYEDINDKSHTTVTVYDELCSCHELIRIIEVSRKVEKHSFDEDACKECGYEKAHVHQGVMCGEKVSWYETLNESFHTYVTANQNLCSCGEYLGLIDEIRQTEKHSFRDDTCTDCGYTRVHVHQGAMCGEKVSWYETLNDTTHTFVKSYEDFCSCGVFLGFIDEIRQNESHTFNGDTCTDCGFIKKHVHESVMCGDEISWYESNNDSTHILITVNEELCACGELLGLTDRRETVENHSITNGTCENCGYYKGEHVHVANQCAKGYTFYVNITENTHTRVEYEGDHICSCGEFVSSGEYQEFEEAHKFKDDVCVHCGSEKHVHVIQKSANIG